MKLKFADLFGQACRAHQSALAGAALLALAFAVIAANAMFNQPGAHPLPLWNPEQKLLAKPVNLKSGLKVPLRRVATKTFSSNPVPVPIARVRQSETVGTIAPIPDQRPSQNSRDEKIQALLTSLGFYEGPVDGLIGAKSRAAISKFEQSRGLPQVGKPTQTLLTRLKAQQNAQSRSQKKYTDANNYDAKVVTRVQVGLINFGNRDIAIDGLMGNQTKLAIEKFQKRFKLKVTGVPSEALIQKLVSVGALTAS